MKAFIFLVLSFFLASCSDEGPAVRSNAQELTLKTGIQFAEALVGGRYAEAQSLLTSELQKQYSPESLAAQYGEMVSYGDGPATVDGQNAFMDKWPDKQAKDIGWSYISISGEGYGEALTVIVTDENGVPKIRDIEWGSP